MMPKTRSTPSAFRIRASTSPPLMSAMVPPQGARAPAVAGAIDYTPRCPRRRSAAFPLDFREFHDGQAHAERDRNARPILSGQALHWLPLLAAVAASGALGGLLAGLLGVGGGIVVVPVLDAALGMAGVPPATSLHLAVATSMATIIPTSMSSTRSHARRGSVDYALMRRWALPIVVGSLAGSLAAAYADARVLAAVFGTVALAAAAKMLLPLDHLVLRKSVPGGVAGAAIPAAIG